MKRSLIILCFSVLTGTTLAQGQITVPSPSELQKYQLAASQWQSSALIQIAYAKSLGKSASDVAGFAADQMKDSWTNAGGYENFIQRILYLTVTLVSYGHIEIREQTEDEVVYLVTGLFSELKEEGSILDVSYREYLEYWGTIFSAQADYMGAEYNQKDTDEGLLVTIRKRDK